MAKPGEITKATIVTGGKKSGAENKEAEKKRGRPAKGGASGEIITNPMKAGNKPKKAAGKASVKSSKAGATGAKKATLNKGKPKAGDQTYPKAEVLKGVRDEPVFVRFWDKVTKPKATVLILHGMVEHGGRYDEFARFLNKRGYIAVAPDHRGHGRTVGDPSCVGQYDGDIFGDSVRDAMKFSDELIERYKLPLIVLGHSYGSFLLQAYVQHYHNYKAAVFVGSANMKGSADVSLGKAVAGITKFFCGKKAKAKMIYKLSFGAYGKPFKDGNWLTGDEEIFKKYNEDPYCGNVCSAQFYRSFFGNLKKLYDNGKLNLIDKEKPVLIMSGELDPVAGKEHKAGDALDTLYRGLGIKHVTYKVWKNGRHEILNETNKKDVWEYTADFLDDVTAK